MVFEYSDSWLLQSICNTEMSDNGSDLTDLIAFADYSNHAVMTFEEFSNGLTKFLALGLVCVNDSRLITSTEFKDWRKRKYENRKRILLLQEIDDFGKYLNKNYGQINVDLSKIDLEISKNYFDKAISDYLNRMKK